MSPAKEFQIQKGLITSHQVYNMVSRHPGESVYQYSRKLGVTPGRTRAAIRRLEEEGLVRTELTQERRPKRIVIPVPAVDLIRRFNNLDPEDGE